MLHVLRQFLPVRALTAAALVTVLAGPVLADDTEVVAMLNGEPITAADLALAETELDQQFAQMPPDQRRIAALTAILEIRLMAQGAEAAGIAEEPEFQRRLDLMRQRLLHAAYIEQAIAGQISEEDLRARYETEIAGLDLDEEVRARHIIVESEEEAAEIIAALDAGGDFEELARERSQDGAAQQGGDLGYFSRGQMVPEFEEAVFAMEVDSYTAEPVQTQFGWHVIKLVDRREQEPPSFSDVQPQLRNLLLREAYYQAVDELRDAADIDIQDEALRAAYEALGEGAEPAAE